MPKSKLYALLLAAVMLVSLAFGAAADDLFASYDVPDGFEVEELYDQDTGAYHLTLNKTDGVITIIVSTSQRDGLTGLDITDYTDVQLTDLLASLEFDLTELGVTAQGVTGTDEVTGTPTSYIWLTDEAKAQDHIIVIYADGLVEYAALIRNDQSPLTDEDYDLFNQFFSSIKANQESP